jgi:hypothetical protein
MITSEERHKSYMRAFGNSYRTPKGCLLPKMSNPHVYSEIRVGQDKIRLHRLTAILFLGLDENNPRQHALHRDDRCEYKGCFNPAHIYVGGRSDNMSDAVKFGKNHNSNKTHCPHGHEYTIENTVMSSVNARVCKICMRGRKYAS